MNAKEARTITNSVQATVDERCYHELLERFGYYEIKIHEAAIQGRSYISFWTVYSRLPALKQLKYAKEYFKPKGYKVKLSSYGKITISW